MKSDMECIRDAASLKHRQADNHAERDTLSLIIGIINKAESLREHDEATVSSILEEVMNDHYRYGG